MYNKDGNNDRLSPEKITETQGLVDLMGRTVERVTVRSFEDFLEVAKGRLEEGKIRAVEIDALVDAGATYLCLPPKLIQDLGLTYLQSRRVKTANGDVERRVFMGAKITIQGRTEQMSVMENDDGTPPLVGDLVLEALDLIVDPRSQKLMPNPAHDGKWMADLY